MEKVLEQIVGVVQDEFDSEEPEVVPQGQGSYLALGRLSIDRISREFQLELSPPEVDTPFGQLTCRTGRLLRQGDKVSLDGAEAEVTQIRGGRATQIRLTLTAEVKAQRDYDSGRKRTR
jgi:CBS domain containing-hemolysin-like protein